MVDYRPKCTTTFVCPQGLEYRAHDSELIVSHRRCSVEEAVKAQRPAWFLTSVTRHCRPSSERYSNESLALLQPDREAPIRRAHTKEEANDAHQEGRPAEAASPAAEGNDDRAAASTQVGISRAAAPSEGVRSPAAEGFSLEGEASTGATDKQPSGRRPTRWYGDTRLHFRLTAASRAR
jgi:hypothetical protein